MHIIAPDELERINRIPDEAIEGRKNAIIDAIRHAVTTTIVKENATSEERGQIDQLRTEANGEVTRLFTDGASSSNGRNALAALSNRLYAQVDKARVEEAVAPYKAALALTGEERKEALQKLLAVTLDDSNIALTAATAVAAKLLKVRLRGDDAIAGVQITSR